MPTKYNEQSFNEKISSLKQQVKELHEITNSFEKLNEYEAIKFLNDSGNIDKGDLRNLFNLLKYHDFDFKDELDLENDFDWFILRLKDNYRILKTHQKEELNELSKSTFQVNCLVHRNDLSKVIDRKNQDKHRIRHKFNINHRLGNQYIMFIEFQDFDSLMKYFSTVIEYKSADHYSKIIDLEKPYKKDLWW